MPKSTEAVWNEIHGVTGPLEKTLKALAENPHGTPTGKGQAKKNLDVVEDLNKAGEQLAAQATHTQSLSVGMRKGSGSSNSSNIEDDRKK